MIELFSNTRQAMTSESPIPAIELRSVSKFFGAVPALQDVSFTIPQGQIVALLGPKGAGKTTAVSLMFVWPTSPNTRTGTVVPLRTL